MFCEERFPRGVSCPGTCSEACDSVRSCSSGPKSVCIGLLRGTSGFRSFLAGVAVAEGGSANLCGGEDMAVQCGDFCVIEQDKVFCFDSKHAKVGDLLCSRVQQRAAAAFDAKPIRA